MDGDKAVTRGVTGLAELMRKLESAERLLNSNKPPTFAEHKLWLGEIIEKLKFVERLVHSNNTTQPPTLAEHRLYGLIFRHVTLYILLFYVEKGPSVPKWLTMEMLLQAEKNANERLLCLELSVRFGKYSWGETCPSSADEVYKELELVGGRGWPLLKLLKETRNDLSKRSTVHAVKSLTKNMMTMPGKALAGYEEEANKRGTRSEVYLFEILQGLEDMGSRREYSPPSLGEISYYEEIRKRVTSCLAFIQAKSVCQCEWHLISKEAQSEEEWSSTFYRDRSPYGILHAPTGYEFSSTLDEVPEFLSLVKDCRSHFSKICSRLYETNGVKESEDVKARKLQDSPIDGFLLMPKDKGNTVVGNNEVKMTRASQSFKLKLKGETFDVVRKLEGCSIVGNMEVKAKTRERYLQDILRIFKKMGLLSLNTQLSIVEVRHYAQIMEHVISSIWMYNGTSMHLQGESAGSEKSNDLAHTEADSSDVGYCLSDGEMKSQEESLHEILLSVIAIKSSFLDTPPSASEVVLYKEILKQMNKELLNSKLRGQLQGEALAEYAKTASNSKFCFLKVAYHWEWKLFKEVEAEYAEMVKSLFPNMFDAYSSVSSPLRWVDDCYSNLERREKAIGELIEVFDSSSDGLVLLDRLILFLTKVNLMFDDCFLRLAGANGYMDALLEKGKVVEAFYEVSSAIEVLKLHKFPHCKKVAS